MFVCCRRSHNSLFFIARQDRPQIYKIILLLLKKSFQLIRYKKFYHKINLYFFLEIGDFRILMPQKPKILIYFSE